MNMCRSPTFLFFFGKNHGFLQHLDHVQDTPYFTHEKKNVRHASLRIFPTEKSNDFLNEFSTEVQIFPELRWIDECLGESFQVVKLLASAARQKKFMENGEQLQVVPSGNLNLAMQNTTFK